MRRTVVLPLLSAILLLTLALPAAALSGGPRLYAVASFAVKPVTIANITGDGSALLDQMKSRGGAIHWSAWTSSRADGAGKIWIDDCIPDTAGGTFHGRPATIHASRVRTGHYTRMTVSFRAGDRMWDEGTTRYVDRYRLQHLSGRYFTWMRL